MRVFALFFVATAAQACTKLDFGGDAVNVLTFGDFSSTSDAEGRVFVGGNFNCGGAYSIGAQIQSKSSVPGGDYLVVRGQVSWEGQMQNGGDIVLSHESKNSLGATITEASTTGNIEVDPDRYDFDGAHRHYVLLSQTLAAMADTGTVDNSQQWELAFLGTGASVEVFTTTCADMNKRSGSSRSFKNIASGATVIVNIEGTSGCGFDQGTFLVNTAGARQFAPRIIYNFLCATSLEILGVGVEGSILAPYAHVGNGAGGVIWGQIIVKSFNSAVQQNHVTFTGCLPAVNIAVAWQCPGTPNVPTTTAPPTTTTTAAPTTSTTKAPTATTTAPTEEVSTTTEEVSTTSTVGATSTEAATTTTPAPTPCPVTTTTQPVYNPDYPTMAPTQAPATAGGESKRRLIDDGCPQDNTPIVGEHGGDEVIAFGTSLKASVVTILLLACAASLRW